MQNRAGTTWSIFVLVDCGRLEELLFFAGDVDKGGKGKLEGDGGARWGIWGTGIPVAELVTALATLRDV